MKNWYCENNYSCSLFLHTLHHRCLTGSEFAMVLNLPVLWICLWFWICQGSGYTRVLNMRLVLIMPRFWIYQSSEYIRVTRGYEYTWICLNNFCICLIMLEYVRICLNIREYARMAFVLLKLVITYFNEVYSLNEHDAVFLKKQNL